MENRTSKTCGNNSQASAWGGDKTSLNHRYLDRIELSKISFSLTARASIATK